jgi:hypothetical protein
MYPAAFHILSLKFPALLAVAECELDPSYSPKQKNWGFDVENMAARKRAPLGNCVFRNVVTL